MNNHKIIKVRCIHCLGDGMVSGITEKHIQNISYPYPSLEPDDQVNCPVCNGNGQTNHVVMEGEELCGCFDGTHDASGLIWHNRAREFYGHEIKPLPKNCKWCGGTGKRQIQSTKPTDK